PLPDGYLWAGGFVLSATTVAELVQLDLTALELPADRLRRALMLDRDGISVDVRLQSHLERTGVSVGVASGQDYGQMMAKPHHARSPRAVFAHVRAWLEEENASAATRDATLKPTEDAAGRAAGASTGELTCGGAGMRENPNPTGRSLRKRVAG